MWTEGTDESVAVWTFLGVLVAFKAFGLVLVLLMNASPQAVAFMVAMHWPWAVLILAGLSLPAVWWYRMLRARAKRQRLIQSEWRVETPAEAESKGRLMD